MVSGQTDIYIPPINDKKTILMYEEGSYKGRLGIGHFTLANGLISSDTYSGNGITVSIIESTMDNRHHSDAEIYFTYAHRLKSSFFDKNTSNKAFQDLQYLRFGIQASYERRIAKSNHFLGGHFNLPVDFVYNSRFENMSPYTSPQIQTNSTVTQNYIVPLSFGGSYFYADYILGIPVRLNATLPIPIPLPKNRVWQISTYYSFECSLSFYKNDNFNFLLMYNWNYNSLSKKQDLIHQYKVGSNSLSFVISFI